MGVASIPRFFLELQQHLGLKGLDTESCNFPTDDCKIWNFRQRILWVLKILILPLNFSNIKDFRIHILYFLEENFSTSIKFFRQANTKRGSFHVPCQDAVGQLRAFDSTSCKWYVKRVRQAVKRERKRAEFLVTSMVTAMTRGCDATLDWNISSSAFNHQHHHDVGTLLGSHLC